MEVGSWVQATTLIVGWKYYDLLWQLMVATGIVFVPIVGLLITSFIEARSRASLGYIGADNVLAQFEGKLLVLFLVFFFCAMPSSVSVQGGTDVRLFSSQNNLLVEPGTPEVQDACSISANSTVTTNQPVSNATNMCQDQVRMPLWWYLTQNLSQGLTMAVVREAATQNNNLHRAVVKFKHNAKIKDQVTRNLLSQVQSQCMEPARALFLERAQNPANQQNFQGVDISWAGADIFITDYYPTLKTESVVVGMAADANLTNQNEPVYQNVNTAQNCLNLWNEVRTRAWAEASVEANRIQRLFGNFNNATVQNRVLEQYVKATPVGETSTTEALKNIRNGNQNFAEEAYGVFTKGFALYELTKAVIKTNMYVDVMIVALPMLQAYLLMFIIMALPFGFILSQYRFSFILKATALLFSISFWPAIWAVVAWIDNELAQQLYAGGDSLASIVGYLLYENGESFGDSISNVITRLSHNLVSMTLYITGPIAFSWVMASAGFGEGTSPAQGTRGLSNTVSSGAGALSSATRQLASGRNSKNSTSANRG